MKNSDEIHWYELSLQQIKENQELIVSRLFELGAEGSVENQINASVTVYFQGKSQFDATAKAASYLESLPSLRFRVSPVAEEDWSIKYRQTFRAQPLGKEFFLVPSWERDTANTRGRIPIIMDAGQAFGTGLHSSTQLALSALESAVTLFENRNAIRLLDVGTGTGILAIAAEKLGVATIDAIDCDPNAIEVATQNSRENRCSRVQLSTRSIRDLQGPYDLILSNILLETHLELAPDYTRLLAVSGSLILSGLLGNQRVEITRALLQQGLWLESTRSLQEWTAMGFIRAQEIS